MGARRSPSPGMQVHLVVVVVVVVDVVDDVVDVLFLLLFSLSLTKPDSNHAGRVLDDLHGLYSHIHTLGGKTLLSIFSLFSAHQTVFALA